MDAPMYSEETVLRAIEAMRDAAKATALDGMEAVQRNGHAAAAHTQGQIARRVGALDAHKILAGIVAAPTGVQPEQGAFEKEAQRLGFSTVRRGDGELFYPMTQRVWAIWQAAVRWKASDINTLTQQ